MAKVGKITTEVKLKDTEFVEELLCDFRNLLKESVTPKDGGSCHRLGIELVEKYANK